MGNLGIFAAQSAAFYFTERSRHKWIRWTGRAFLAHEIEEHTRFAACNAGLNAHSLVTQNCGQVMPFESGTRRCTLFRPATRAFYREILGVRVRVNLIALLKNLSDLSIVTGEAAFGM